MKLVNRIKQNCPGKILTPILVLVILGALGILSYILAMPQETGERFTEFYILGLEGKAAGYPTELGIGEEGRVILGIVNREYQRVNYRVEIAVNGVSNSEIGPLILEHQERWEGEASFRPTKAGDNQKVEFMLYEEGKPLLKEQLHLWINVNVKG